MTQDQNNQDQTSALVVERLAPLETLDRSFDVEFWQRQDSTARFSAAWEMVEFAHQLRDATELRKRATSGVTHRRPAIRAM